MSEMLYLIHFRQYIYFSDECVVVEDFLGRGAEFAKKEMPIGEAIEELEWLRRTDFEMEVNRDYWLVPKN